jgi:hypothetical protein
MPRMKSIVLSALACSATLGTLTPSASAVRFRVNGPELLASRDYNSNRTLTGRAVLESYITEKPYAFACWSVRVDGKLRPGGEMENEVRLSSCHMFGYTAAHQEESVPNCTVTTPIKLVFKGVLTGVIGNQLWEGNEGLRKAGKITVGGVGCAAGLANNYIVAGEPTCSLWAAEVEWRERYMLCIPAGLPKETTYTLTSEEAGALTYPLRMTLAPTLNVLRGGESHDPLWSITP